MKKIMIFYQEKCPFCKRAFQFIEELKSENPQYDNIEIESIEETLQSDFANSYDYYYVPTFYIENVKMHEGGIYKEEVKKILEAALE